MTQMLGTDKAALEIFVVFLDMLAGTELDRIVKTDPCLEFTIVKHRHRYNAYRYAAKLVSAEIEELDE
jgi:hypothetical protein